MNDAPQLRSGRLQNDGAGKGWNLVGMFKVALCDERGTPLVRRLHGDEGRARIVTANATTGESE
jgi:hypothetical protein